MLTLGSDLLLLVQHASIGEEVLGRWRAHTKKRHPDHDHMFPCGRFWHLCFVQDIALVHPALGCGL